MSKTMILRICALSILAIAIPIKLFAETVGVYYDTTAEQIEFAAGDVKTALESRHFTVEIIDIGKLNDAYPNKKVVIALGTDIRVKEILSALGGTFPSGLSEQVYALRTTTQGQTSYWLLGGENNGAMYGGLQLAENISINGFYG